ncbi:class A beta-lactamase [Telmatospirillum sp. J64-1]|uniref:class A beta-lactamase n=1 Tax=Telmatospirillum sp. J64-1 TaxID=2502183 RepID=UPI00115DFC4A|nr:class A beta-lactamase [Telmatospirillum sp. J64-1]
MTFEISRRAALAAPLLALPVLGAGQAVARELTAPEIQALFAELESQHGGQLGVMVHNLGTGATACYREDERFAMCSTFKVLAAAYVMARVDRGQESLDRRVVFSQEDIVSWSPVTEKRVGGEGMTMAEICDASMTISDNTAANLQLASFGGPSALTAYLRRLGDNVTRLDRFETELNENAPGDRRDTTTPAAMAETLRKIFFEDVLSKSSRAQLASWFIANKTGDKRLRAGFPDTWLVGDRTGTSGNGAAHAVAIAWPTDRAPVIVTSYYNNPSSTDEVWNAVHEEVARIAATV